NEESYRITVIGHPGARQQCRVLRMFQLANRFRTNVKTYTFRATTSAETPNGGRKSGAVTMSNRKILVMTRLSSGEFTSFSLCKRIPVRLTIFRAVQMGAKRR